MIKLGLHFAAPSKTFAHWFSMYANVFYVFACIIHSFCLSFFFVVCALDFSPIFGLCVCVCVFVSVWNVIIHPHWNHGTSIMITYTHCESSMCLSVCAVHRCVNVMVRPEHSRLRWNKKARFHTCLWAHFEVRSLFIETFVWSMLELSCQ